LINEKRVAIATRFFVVVNAVNISRLLLPVARKQYFASIEKTFKQKKLCLKMLSLFA